MHDDSMAADAFPAPPRTTSPAHRTTTSAARNDSAPKQRRSWFNIIYRVALIAFSVFVLLDTFVIPRVYSAANDGAVSEATAALRESAGTSVATSAPADGGTAGSASGTDATAGGTGSNRGHGKHRAAAAPIGSSSSSDPSSANASSSAESATNSSDPSTAVATSTSYEGDGVSIKLTTDRYEDTTVYVADITVDSIAKLQSALANDTYGKNITATTSSIAAAHKAVLAINGDYYGAQNAGFVIRNGVLYRDTIASASREDLVIYADGSFDVVTEGSVSAQELLDAGAWQVYSFGPGLVIDGTIAVDANDEVAKARTSNPRTAIAQVDEGHYLMVVADGRTNDSEGLSLYQLATYLKGLGAQTAYNLDGGGSSTLYFNGDVINNPTSGQGSSERKVSDIVFISA